METILYVLIFGFLMSMIALVGVVTLFLNTHLLNSIMLPLISFSAGSLIGGALFHMIPAGVNKMGNETEVYVWIMAGFALFLGTEQFLNWHHSHTHAHTCGPLSPAHEHGVCSQESQTRVAGLGACGNAEHAAENSLRWPTTTTCEGEPISRLQGVVVEADEEPGNNHVGGEERGNSDDHMSVDSHPATTDSTRPTAATVVAAEQQRESRESRESLGYLILLADAVHNFVGGMFVAASFLDSTNLGLTAWTAAAAHEVPQELGDFAILVHAGWSYAGALLANFLSSLTFPLGMVVAYAASKSVHVSFLIPFAAGNFLYIGATDLIPEVKHCRGIKRQAVNYASFLAGLGLLLLIRIVNDGW